MQFSRPRRWVPPNSLWEITARAFQGRLLLRPGPPEADAIRARGAAEAEATRAGVEAIGESGYTTLELIRIIGERGVRIVPDVSVSGGAGGVSGVMEALTSVLLRGEAKSLAARVSAATPVAVEAAKANGRA